MLSLAEAGIISTTLQGMLYGLSILMFILTLWILIRNRKRRGLNYGMIVCACALLVLSTAEFAVNIVRLIQGLLTKGPQLAQGLETYFADVTQPTFVIKGVLYNLQTLILDGVVIYRAYVVWQRWYVVVLPILGWLGLAVMTVGANLSLARASDTANVFAEETGRWLIAIYATTLATNITATGLLAYRIWQAHSRSVEYLSSERSGLYMVLRIVIESGAIYSATIIAGLVTFIIGSPGVYVLIDMISPIISIVFNMIIVRVGFATDKRLSEIAGSSTTRQQSGLHFAERSESRPQRNTGFEMKSLAIELTQHVETDADTSSVNGKAAADLAGTSSDERKKPSSGL